MPSASGSGNNRGNGKGNPSRKAARAAGPPSHKPSSTKQSGTKVRRAGRPSVQAKAKNPARRKPTLKKKGTGSKGQAATGAASKKRRSISDLLTPKNVQESMKTVGNLRSMVKSGLGYLQQADQMLETLYATSNSLKESGVLDKIIKEKGKNLSTEDFTNILMALMSSPIGGQLFKSMGAKDSDATNAGES